MVVTFEVTTIFTTIRVLEWGVCGKLIDMERSLERSLERRGNVGLVCCQHLNKPNPYKGALANEHKK
jgi:hypothetical protein